MDCPRPTLSFFWLSDASPFVSVFPVLCVDLCAFLLRDARMGAVTLTGYARGVQTHPLASYFLVRPLLIFVYFQVNTGVSSVLDRAEEICLVSLSDPPKTLNPNT